MSKRLWFVSVFVSLGFVHVFAWYQIPAQFYLRHVKDFATPLAELLGISVMMGAGSLLLTVIIGFFVFMRVRKPAAPVFVALAFTFWIVYSLFGQFDPLIDENFARVDLEQFRAVTEVLVFTVLVALLIRYRRYLQIASLLLLSLAAVFYTVYTMRQVTALEIRQQPGPAASKLFALSAVQNLLVIQMAAFQSDYLSTWLQREPELADAFEGFHYFPDMLGAGSRPGPVVDAAIHAGYQYDPFIPVRNVEADYLDGGSVFSKLAMAGARVQIFQRGRKCPYRTSCINSADILRGTAQVRLADTMYAIDAALLIMFPEALKNLVYRKGHWLLGSLYPGGGTARGKNPPFEDHALLRMFAGRVEPADAVSRVSYLRLENTSAPESMSADCNVLAARITGDRKIAENQARCALLDLSHLLSALKRINMYHSTAVVVLADTGAVRDHTNLALHGTGDSRNRQSSINELIGSANPLLLIKPVDSGGPLIIDQRPARLDDLPATLCGLSKLCRWPYGNDLFSNDLPDNEPRQFLAYSAWQYDANLGLINEPQRFQLSGPVREPSSWKRIIDKSHINYEDAVNFSSFDNHEIFGAGWGLVEIDPTAGSKRWAVAKQADLNLNLAPGADYLLNFVVYPPGDIARQTMELHVNGHWAGKYEIKPGVHELLFRLPAAYILPGRDVIKLGFSELAKPAGADERELAMSFFRLKIGRVEPAYVLEDL